MLSDCSMNKIYSLKSYPQGLKIRTPQPFQILIAFFLSLSLLCPLKSRIPTLKRSEN